MNFGNIFSKIRRQQPSSEEAPSHWIKCKSCNSLMYYKEVENLLNVCPKCNFHMRISVDQRIKIICDKESFIEFDEDLKANDPLNFVDKKSYKKRIIENTEKTGKNSSAISGECKINGILSQIVIFDFSFMGGSLGSVEGEKIVRAVNRALDKKTPLIIVSASGGARMQESTFALLQMSKTSASLARLDDAKLPYISILTDPTMGGVSASLAMLGDVNIAEPNALIGFAGPRVIKATINQELPAGFQTAQFALEHGIVDRVVSRAEMRGEIARDRQAIPAKGADQRGTPVQGPELRHNFSHGAAGRYGLTPAWFDFDVGREAGIQEKPKGLLEGWDRFPGELGCEPGTGLKLAQVRQGRVRHEGVGPRGAFQAIVVKQHRHAVATQHDIEFYPLGALLGGHAQTGEGVFRGSSSGAAVSHNSWQLEHNWLCFP